MKSNSWSKTLALLFSVASLLCIAIGVGFAIRSPLFLVQVVEIGEQTENSPVDAQTISDLAAVPVGKVNLFDLDLNAVEKRILGHPWIRRVNLQKRFPQTLSISVVFRDPHALLQGKSGNLSYVDTDGKIFGRVNVLARSNLPMLTGISEQDEPKIRQALQLIDAWDRLGMGSLAQLSSLSWEQERGFHAWVSYPTQESRARAVVDLGQDPDLASLNVQLRRLGSVLRYLSQHSVPAHQIWADSGKKIVVRTAHGS